jgi:hypothetical protein
MSQNPLIAAYKKPALYISLPSGGKYYEPKLKLSVDGELAVYAMTARDELITKTPDALFNGEATMALIESCCPDITDPRQVPVNDLLVILLAIRQASYGDSLDVDMTCPQCEHLNMLTINTSNMLSKAKSIDIEDTITLDNGFIVKVKPFNVEDRTLLQIQQVKQQKLLNSLSGQSTMDEEEFAKKYGEVFVELADLTVKLITNCIRSVKSNIESESISERDTISEWLQSISKKDYDLIRDKVEDLSDNGLDTKAKATCQECKHQWETEIELDVANFFEGS